MQVINNFIDTFKVKVLQDYKEKVKNSFINFSINYQDIKEAYKAYKLLEEEFFNLKVDKLNIKKIIRLNYNYLLKTSLGINFTKPAL